MLQQTHSSGQKGKSLKHVRGIIHASIQQTKNKLMPILKFHSKAMRHFKSQPWKHFVKHTMTATSISHCKISAWTSNYLKEQLKNYIQANPTANSIVEHQQPQLDSPNQLIQIEPNHGQAQKCNDQAQKHNENQ